MGYHKNRHTRRSGCWVDNQADLQRNYLYKTKARPIRPLNVESIPLN